MAATSHADHGHDPHLAHHFENPAQQFQAARLGMWIFLATEVLFFGGLFVAYAVYRVNHPEIFIFAHQFLDKNLGAINTVILICSSFTMAWAVRAAQLRQGRMLRLMLALTLLCASGFLSVKYVEYHQKWEHGLLWARQYQPHGHEAGTAAPHGAVEPSAEPEPVAALPGGDRSTIPPAPEGPAGLAGTAADGAPPGHPVMAEPKNVQVFFSIYFMMTGLHGVHVLGGMAAMIWLFVKSLRGAFTDGYFTPVDMAGLYWHLVDLIWIYLFLLLYLIH